MWTQIYLTVIAIIAAAIMFMTYEKFCKDQKCQNISLTFAILAVVAAAVIVGVLYWKYRNQT